MFSAIQADACGPVGGFNASFFNCRILAFSFSSAVITFVRAFLTTTFFLFFVFVALAFVLTAFSFVLLPLLDVAFTDDLFLALVDVGFRVAVVVVDAALVFPRDDVADAVAFRLLASG